MGKRKLRLDLEKLGVESFPTTGKVEGRGTVRGNEGTHVDDCGWSWVGTSCGSTVWEAGCSEVTASADCGPTEGGYTHCQFTM